LVRVLMLEWDTLFPLNGLVPVKSHTRAMTDSFLFRQNQ